MVEDIKIGIKYRKVMSMSGRYLAVLLCKVLAIYVFIWAINYTGIIGMLPVSFAHAGTREMLYTALSFLVPFVLLAVLGVFLWIRAEYMSHRMVGAHSEDVKAAGAEDVQAIAFSAVGVLALSDALPKFVQQLFSIIAMSQTQMFSLEGMYISNMSGIAGSVVKLILGFWLFFGSRGIVHLLRSLRKAGLKKPSGEET